MKQKKIETRYKLTPRPRYEGVPAKGLESTRRSLWVLSETVNSFLTPVHFCDPYPLLY